LSLFLCDKFKLGHIEANPYVALNFDGDGLGGNIIVFTGEARLDPAAGAPGAGIRCQVSTRFRAHWIDHRTVCRGLFGGAACDTHLAARPLTGRSVAVLLRIRPGDRFKNRDKILGLSQKCHRLITCGIFVFVIPARGRFPGRFSGGWPAQLTCRPARPPGK